MTIRTIASSSAGNAYQISDGENQILIEAGIPFPRLQVAIGHGVSGITAAFISHSHGDHAKGVEGLLKAGCPVYMSEATRAELGIHHHRLITVEPEQWYRAGNFRFMPLRMHHDVECFGWYFMTASGEALLFATDTSEIPYRFDRIDYLMVECNFCDPILAADDRPFIRDRVRKTHMGLSGLIQYLTDENLTHTKQITLMHLSDGHSDEREMKRAVEAATGKPVVVAGK